MTAGLDLGTIAVAPLHGVMLGSTRHPFHTRRINDVALRDGHVVTVGEDGSARVAKIGDDGAAPVCVSAAIAWVDRNAIRCLAAAGDLIFTGGAKLQLLAFRVSDGDLRVIGRARGGAFDRRGKWFRRPQADLDAERQSALDLRLMSIAVVADADDAVTLVAGSSIGTLSVYRFCRRTSTFALTSTTTSPVHGRHPVLALGATLTGIVSGDTRGRVALWRYDDDLRHVDTAAGVHQSGVNCAAVLALPGASDLVVTGGDDHALRLLLCDADALRPVAAVDGAHGAAVTAVGAVLRRGAVMIFTTGPDRHVRIWTWSASAAAVNLIGSVRIDCADAAALDVRRPADDEYDVVVAGQGLQHIRVRIVD